MPSAKLRSASLGFYVCGVCVCGWAGAVGDRTPASRTPSGRSNHCATRGRSDDMGSMHGKSHSLSVPASPAQVMHSLAVKT